MLTTQRFHQRSFDLRSFGAADQEVGRPNGAMQARITLDGGKTITKSFSVCQYGVRKEFELAVKARWRVLAGWAGSASRSRGDGEAICLMLTPPVS